MAQKDIDLYLGIIEERAKSHMNGARWMLRSYTELIKKTNRDEALTVLTSSIIKNQQSQIPGHKWELPDLRDLDDYKPSQLKVSEFMTTDLFTVQRTDIIEMVAEMMDWRKTRYLPVENTKGKLVGLITSRMLLKEFAKKQKLKEAYNNLGKVKSKNIGPCLAC